MYLARYTVLKHPSPMTLPKMKSLAVLLELRFSGWGALRAACSAAADEGAAGAAGG